LRRCLRDQKAQGHGTAIIPWVGPVGFYSRYADARLARVFYRYEKHLIKAPACNDVCCNVRQPARPGEYH
jgi:hypothetical protein